MQRNGEKVVVMRGWCFVMGSWGWVMLELLTVPGGNGDKDWDGMGMGMQR
jgi:hypothetical protein